MIETTRLEGSRKDIGRIQGSRIRDLRLPTTTGAQRSFSASCRSLVERRHPAMMEEFSGMLEASALPEDDFASYYFGRTAPAAGGCTNLAVVAASTDASATIVGRNYDWAYSDRRWCEARTIAPTGEPRRIGYTHHWGGLCDGMNEYGLTICIASLPGEGVVTPGLQWHIVVDMVLSTCRTADEAASLLLDIPHVRSLAYLVADPVTAQLIEASSSEVVSHPPEDGLLVGTNHRIGRIPTHGMRETPSIRRRDGARKLLKPHAGNVTREHVIQVLADHDSGICAGVHAGVVQPHSGDASSGTIWSLIAHPAARTVEVAAGHPCVSSFRQISW